MGDKIKVGVIKDLRFNKLEMECISHTVESGYDELLDIIKTNMKNIEYEASDTEMMIEKKELFQVASIFIDEQDITVNLKPVDETDVYLKEVDLEDLKFKDQMMIINYLITKVKTESIEVEKEDLPKLARKSEEKKDELIIGESEWR